MGFNSGLPKYATYSAYNTDTSQFVSGDEANHTIVLDLDGVALGAPTNAIVSVGNGVYQIALTDAERTGSDLVIRGSSATANVIIVGNHFSSDVRLDEVFADDGEGNLRYTAKALELAPDSVADVSNLATTAQVQAILDQGGAGPWTTASVDLSGVALEETLQLVKGITDKLTFNADDILQADVQWWQGIELTGTNMIQDHAGDPKWTALALSLAPAGGGGGGSVSYVHRVIEEPHGYLEIYRGDTFNFPLLLSMSMASVQDVVLSIKRDTEDLDTEALLLVSALKGLEVINGEVSAEPTNGTLTINDSTVGLIQTIVAAEEMAKLPEICRTPIIEVQVRTADAIFTPWRKQCSIQGDVVRTTD